MATIVRIPDDLVEQLQATAEHEQLCLDELVARLLGDAIAADGQFPSLEEVVARIQATPPNPALIQPATASVQDMPLETEPDPRFDVADWKRQWDAVEAEVRSIARADDLAEGRA